MKKLLLLLLFPSFLFSQIINFPDPAFKAKLLSASPTNYVASAIGSALYVTIDTNNDGEIQVEEAAVIDYLSVPSANISSMEGILAFSNITSLSCQNNNISQLDLTGLTDLSQLEADSNPLTSIILEGCTAINWIRLDQTSITHLDVSGFTNLESLILHNTPELQFLNAAGCTSLTTISAMNTGASALDVSGCVALYEINMMYSNLQSVNIAGCTSLWSATFSSGQLTTLDASDCSSLNALHLDGNPIETLFIKNGADEQSLSLDSEVLQYICADDFQLEAWWLQPFVSTPISSYCSFTPGGPYNTIAGNMKFDSGGNCSATSISIDNFQVLIADGINSGIVSSNQAGQYNLYVQQPNITITPSIENPSLFTVSPTNAILNFPANNGSTETVDFCVSPNGIHSDLEVILIPLGSPMPGFDFNVKMICRNKGNQLLSGTAGVTYDEAVYDYISANPAPSLQSSGMMQFSYSNLAPFQSMTYNIVLNLNGPMETPPININDVVTLTASSTVAGDETPADNTFALAQTVVGSFDPNDKHCLQGAIVSDSTIGQYLHYIINFENTGNAPAQNIVVRDIIDSQMYDLNSFQFLGSSHPVEVRRTANKFEFIHEGIQLAPQGTGYVLFKIKSKNTLSSGDTVSNKADIFFDYNWPIETNLAQTTFQSLGTASHNIIGFSVYPNPAGNSLNLQSSETITSASIFDASGRTVVSAEMQEKTAAMDVSALSAGIYFVRIATASGSAMQKFKKL